MKPWNKRLVTKRLMRRLLQIRRRGPSKLSRQLNGQLQTSKKILVCTCTLSHAIIIYAHITRSSPHHSAKLPFGAWSCCRWIHICCFVTNTGIVHLKHGNHTCRCSTRTDCTQEHCPPNSESSFTVEGGWFWTSWWWYVIFRNCCVWGSLC